jgi:cytochrome c oxidase assembly protein subunit 15
MSGAKTALVYPEWPLMNGKFVPNALTDISMWTVDNLVNYESSPFQPALIQFLHRMTAYGLTIMVLAFVVVAFRRIKSPMLRTANGLLITLLIIQVLLGIATVVSSIGQVPVGLGVAHQFTAIALTGVVVYVNYLFRPGRLLVSVDKSVEKAD